jgi:membrane-bound metal-dependent hydrolase YbcI (DUF457 family)
MRRRGHVAIGIVIFFLYSYFMIHFSTITDASLLFGIVAVVIGSVLPDIIEPPISSKHRGFFHSKGVLVFTFIAFIATDLTGINPFFLSTFSRSYSVSSFFLGYSFHLLADSLTPAGLPG